MSKIERYPRINYQEAWKSLNNLFTVLRSEDVKIPASVVQDLRDAKTMIHIFEADPSHLEHLSRIEAHFNKAESYLVPAAEERFGSEYAERWMRMAEQAKRKPIGDKEEKAVYKLAASLVEYEPWVRIQVSEDIPQEKIERLAEENELLHTVRTTGSVLIHGDSEKIGTFIKKMAEKLGNQRYG